MRISTLWQQVVLSLGLREQLTMSSNDSTKTVSPVVKFSETWHILGPWQIGTREAAWGADPLEQFGGIRALQPSRDAVFRSSLGYNGTVSWIPVRAEVSRHSKHRSLASLSIGFDNIEWIFLQQVYGWASLQWQAWARGTLKIDSTTPQTIVLYTDYVLELWVDDQHYYGGDFYAFRRAPLVLQLDPGHHTIDIRVTRDVRAMGGVGKATVDLQLEAVWQEPFLKHGEVLIPEIVDSHGGRFTSSYASVIMRNDAAVDAWIDAVRGIKDNCSAELISKVPVKIATGQTRPVALRVACVEHSGPPVKKLHLQFEYRYEGQDAQLSLAVEAKTRSKSMQEPQKVTFMHPGGMVSYMIVRPPSKLAVRNCGSNATLPVMLALHGANNEAASDLIRRSLDEVPDLCAWVLFPTGTTPWSGDDWHTWGFADVEAAVAAIPDYIRHVEWTGPGVDIDRWLVVGHSNGGQGTWYALLHRPDKVIAAAPSSGYPSIQNYLPYTFWQPCEPGRWAVMQAALLSWRHELLLGNAKGIPVLQQHGSHDDNVPAYNARLMAERIRQVGADSLYVEVPGAPHYWDGVLTTPALKAFYEQQLSASSTNTSRTSEHFSLVVANPGDTGSKGGVQIISLATPGQLGRIDVDRDFDNRACSFRTSNVGLWKITAGFHACDSFLVDGQQLDLAGPIHTPGFIKKIDAKWALVQDHSLPRTPKQMLTLKAILQTNGTFQVVQHTDGTQASKISLQISRNLCQYYSADTLIISSYEDAKAASGNIISVAVGLDLLHAHTAAHPVRLHSDFLLINGSTGMHRYTAEQGLAAIFLRPVEKDRLELVVWAASEDDLRIAAHLVPLLTGTGIPDFVVADRSMLWKGLDGALALGWFDDEWQVKNSFFS